MLRTLLVVFLVLMMIGLLPVWPYSHGWGAGYYPSGGLLLLMIVVLFLLSDSRASVL